MKKTNIINIMSYDELMEASSVMDTYVHGGDMPEIFNSENLKNFADEIHMNRNDFREIGKLSDKLSSKIVYVNKKSVLDIEEARKKYQQLMMN